MNRVRGSRRNLVAYPPGGPARRINRFDAGLRYVLTERVTAHPEHGWMVFDTERQWTVRTYRGPFAKRRATRRWRNLNGAA